MAYGDWRTITTSVMGACSFTGCVESGPPFEIEPAPEALAPFTTTLRDSQPENAFAAVYRVGDGHLVWIAAKHSTRTESVTFRVVGDAYEAFEFDSVIGEGCPYTWGANPDRVIERALGWVEEDGFLRGGEQALSIRLAQRNQVEVWCGEPDDSEIRARVLAAGHSDDDLLGFYTLRSIPQWIRERRISGADDPGIESLIETELSRNRERLDLSETHLRDVRAWSAWYERVNGKPFGAAFVSEETGPLADGDHGTNSIGAAISAARATFLHERAAEHLANGETLAVVYGASHLMIHRPALDAMLGEPCYVGGDLMERGALDGPCR